MRQQLDQVDQRLQRGDIGPSMALRQAQVWNTHLDESAQSTIRQRIERAEEIERMNPLQRAQEGLVGIGTSILKTGQTVLNVSDTINNLNPITAGGRMIGDTLVRTARTGDLGRSFDESARAQTARTHTALGDTMRTGQAIGSIANDVNNVNPVLAPGQLLADTVVNTVRTGDLSGSAERAWNRRVSETQDSAGRVVRLAGDVTGANKIASGDPRLVGEGVSDLGMLLAPYATSKTVRPAVAANNTVPVRGALPAVPEAPIPAAQPPVAAPTPRVVTVEPPTPKPYQPFAPTTDLPMRSLPNGQRVPAPDPLAIAPDGTVHPHTTLGTHTSEAGGYSYVQSSTFPGGRPSVYGTEQVPWGRTDWSSHPSTGTPHPVPHTHPVIMDPTPFGTGGRPGKTIRIPASGDDHMIPGVAGGNIEFTF